MTNFNYDEMRTLSFHYEDVKRVIVKIPVSDTAVITVPHYYNHIIMIGVNDNNILIGINDEYTNSKFYFSIDDIWYCVLIDNDKNLKNINFTDYFTIDKPPCIDCVRKYYGDYFKSKTQNHIDFRAFIGA